MERGEGLKDVGAALSVIATDEYIRVSGSSAVLAKCAAQDEFPVCDEMARPKRFELLTPRFVV